MLCTVLVLCWWQRIQYASLVIQAFWCAVNKILEARTITCVPAMAPACGLYLADVKYDFTSKNPDEQNVDGVSEYFSSFTCTCHIENHSGHSFILVILTACHVVQMIDQGMIMDVDQFEPTMSVNNCNLLHRFLVLLRSAD